MALDPKNLFMDGGNDVFSGKPGPGGGGLLTTLIALAAGAASGWGVSQVTKTNSQDQGSSAVSPNGETDPTLDGSSAIGVADNAEKDANQESADRANEFTKLMQENAMAFNSQEAQKARDFEREMQNTYWQRTISDMKAAGLNPAMLFGSYSGGSSAVSAPSASIGYSSGSSGASFSFDSLVNSSLSGLLKIVSVLNVLSKLG